MIVTLEDAKSDLSSLIDRAAKGEEVLIQTADRPMVRLVPIDEPTKKRRQPGAWKGQAWIADDFDDPLPPDVLKAFYGET